MALDFPDAPLPGDIYVAGNTTWTWEPPRWTAVTATQGPAGPQGPPGPQGPEGVGPKEVFSGPTPPSPEVAETIWFNTTDGFTYLRLDDGTSEQWVPLSPQGGGQNGGQDEGAYP